VEDYSEVFILNQNTKPSINLIKDFLMQLMTLTNTTREQKRSTRLALKSWRRQESTWKHTITNKKMLIHVWMLTV
jgi:hypothetical protein